MDNKGKAIIKVEILDFDGFPAYQDPGKISRASRPKECEICFNKGGCIVKGWEKSFFTVDIYHDQYHTFVPVPCYFRKQLDIIVNGTNFELVSSDSISKNVDDVIFTSYLATVFRHKNISFIGGNGWEDFVLQHNVKFGDHLRFNVCKEEPNTMWVSSFFRVRGARELESKDRVVTAATEDISYGDLNAMLESVVYTNGLIPDQDKKDSFRRLLRSNWEQCIVSFVHRFTNQDKVKLEIPDQVKQRLDAWRVLQPDKPAKGSVEPLMHEPIIRYAGGYKIDKHGTLTVRYGWKAIIKASSVVSADIMGIQFYLLDNKLTMLISIL